MAEVDAVMKRLVDALRKYEAHDPETVSGATITDLENARLARVRAEEAVIHGEAIQQKSLAALGDAHQQAAEIVAAAKEEADRIRQNALADSAGLVARRNERSEALITSTLSEVRSLRSRALKEINDYHDSKRSEAGSLIQTAELTSGKIVEDARHEAGSILGRARREHTELERRLAQLRTAISGIEDQFRDLAESTLEQTEVMASMIDLETLDIEEVAEEREPEVVRLTQPHLTVDLTDQTNSSRYAVPPGSTIYERRGGGLRSRLENEGASEDDD